MADERPGIDVDGAHGFRRIDHQITAGLERDLAFECLLDFVFDAIQVENRPLARVVLQAVSDLGHQFGDELRGFLKGFPGVDADLLDFRAHQVTQGAQRQTEVFVDYARRTDGFDLGVDLIPKTAQITDVHKDFIRAGTFGCRAQDETASFLDTFLGHAISDHLFEAFALGFVFDLQRNTDMGRARHVHQIT
ncbi:hypothetical protein D3C76_1098230 [compost metagenome]